MNRQDPTSEELLSAYLDGELSLEQRRQVEQWLAVSAEHRQLFEQLRGLNDQLQHLAKFRLGDAFTERVLAEVAAQVQLAGSGLDDGEFSDELLSACLDGEASAEQQRQVAAWLSADPSHQQHFDELRQLQASLRALPTYKLDQAFAERVLEAAERRGPDASASGSEATVAVHRPAANAADARWSYRAVWATAALAAAILLALYLPWRAGSNQGGSNVVAQPGSANVPPSDNPQPQPAESKKVAPATVAKVPRPAQPIGEKPPVEPNLLVQQSTKRPPVEAPVTPSGKPAVVPPDPLAASPKPKAAEGGSSMVDAIRPMLNKRLLLVYEVQVTPEGAENAVFPKLLQRHQIHLLQATPLDREEQADLLKQRFLKGAEAIDQARPGVDEIQLFLATCSGRQADAIYFDLRKRPEGIAAFALNLTAKDTGDGALGRVCAAHAPKSDQAEAVQLLANIAILSSSARGLGALGGIRWVDPALLEPSAKPLAQAKPNASAEAGASEPALSVDSFFELLMVVRNLKPLAAAPPANP